MEIYLRDLNKEMFEEQVRYIRRLEESGSKGAKNMLEVIKANAKGEAEHVNITIGNMEQLKDWKIDRN